MATLSDGIELQFFSKSPLLITESAEDFAMLKAGLIRDISPRGIIQQMYVADVAAIIWEILRLRRCKVGIVNLAFKDALSDTIYRLTGEPELGTPDREWMDRVCVDWFSKPNARKEVLDLLKEFHLDESGIEAEAIRSKFSELETIDRMLMMLESRLNKALRSIADYREVFAKNVREASNRVIEGAPVVQLENRSAQRPA